MRTVVHEMRGIPHYLLKEYLQELGGTLIGEDLIQGNGWSVKIEKMEPFRTLFAFGGTIPFDDGVG